MIETMRVELGKYIVKDSKICAGELTFKDTRFLVKDALAYLKVGMNIDELYVAFYERVPKEAFQEAIDLAANALTHEHSRRKHSSAGTRKATAV